MNRLLASKLLGVSAAVSLAAAIVPRSATAPLLLVGGGAASVALTRRRGQSIEAPRLQLVSRVSLSPRAQAALLSVDGKAWLVVVGEGCAQLARAELSALEGTP